MEESDKLAGLEFIVTGGAGFIGSNFIRYLIKNYPNSAIINVDKLTYSGNKSNLGGLEIPNYVFIQSDIRDLEQMKKLIKPSSIIINFAAESHVDNSITDSHPFVSANIVGAHSLLEAARAGNARLFVQVSTDEVYGSLSFDSYSSRENDALKPSSPYSASKAAAEMLCLASITTFNQPIIITRSSNNFGPYQYPEKVIPLFVTNLLEGRKVQLYGTGSNVRDWIYVEDNCEAIDFVIRKGGAGRIYNIGGGNEIQNIELTRIILEEMKLDERMIEYVKDRQGHDCRYSLDCFRIRSLGWKPRYSFREALRKTIQWYEENESWWRPLKRGRAA